jgi:hypothetical protein
VAPTYGSGWVADSAEGWKPTGWAVGVLIGPDESVKCGGCGKQLAKGETVYIHRASPKVISACELCATEKGVSV